MPVLKPLTVRNQFPDYPTNALPDLTGFEDVSWHNDMCPSFRKGDFIVWVDWPDPRDREDYEGARFVVQGVDKDGCLTEDEPALETDEWQLVLDFTK